MTDVSEPPPPPVDEIVDATTYVEHEPFPLTVALCPADGMEPLVEGATNTCIEPHAVLPRVNPPVKTEATDPETFIEETRDAAIEDAFMDVAHDPVP